MNEGCYSADEILRAARAVFREVPAPRWAAELVRRLRAGEGAPPPADDEIEVSEVDRAAARRAARRLGLVVRDPTRKR